MIVIKERKVSFWIGLLAVWTGLQFAFFVIGGIGTGNIDAGFILISALFSCGTLLYFLPGVIAWFRNHHQTMAITILNLFAGWTFIGWVAALVWACTSPKPRVAALVAAPDTRWDALRSTPAPSKIKRTGVPVMTVAWNELKQEGQISAQTRAELAALDIDPAQIERQFAAA
jgi:hypothetical protein